ncbi:hypothetical protein CAPTEDRAFT_156801 [Capitella teleta]|uniref:Receptor expression-enhancing protein n=1 Tax=Capitella teleta TaxID=283909 RepID=R7UZN7_CAPTE|nr:hypothetical protein CAPTEDRAFT_156801 [Capitella teleta]|eukprot:ELU09427.1 hypothetical protein CAPTEDRAFT_156801 [Capitella teleta]
MVSAIISRVVILVFGTLYPAYASYKAVKTKNVKEYVKWMMYWIVFALFTCVETVGDLFISWIPFYYELKIIFVLWLLSPATKGSSILYRKFVHPQLTKREKEIDAAIAKASDQGYTALLSLGSRGFNYATNVVLTTAMKGQSTIADHLKKSYSLNDLSPDEGDGQRRVFSREDSLALTDEETDNRFIEESYCEEMQEEATTEKPRKRTVRKSKEAELSAVSEEKDEIYEDSNVVTTRSGRVKKTTYSHKEAYHYGTLPKTRSKGRPSVKNVAYQ